MEIKKLNADDVKAHWNSLFELLQICFVSTYKSEKDKAFIDSKLNSLTEYVNCGKAVVFGALFNGELLGFLWGYPVDTPFETLLHAAYFAVKENARKQGIGSLLINNFEKEAVGLGIAHIELIVGAENKGAIKFYDRSGYKADRIILRKEV